MEASEEPWRTPGSWGRTPGGGLLAGPLDPGRTPGFWGWTPGFLAGPLDSWLDPWILGVDPWIPGWTPGFWLDPWISSDFRVPGRFWCWRSDFGAGGHFEHVMRLSNNSWNNISARDAFPLVLVLVALVIFCLKPSAAFPIARATGWVSLTFNLSHR